MINYKIIFYILFWSTIVSSLLFIFFVFFSHYRESNFAVALDVFEKNLSWTNLWILFPFLSGFLSFIFVTSYLSLKSYDEEIEKQIIEYKNHEFIYIDQISINAFRSVISRYNAEEFKNFVKLNVSKPPHYCIPSSVGDESPYYDALMSRVDTEEKFKILKDNGFDPKQCKFSLSNGNQTLEKYALYVQSNSMQTGNSNAWLRIFIDENFSASERIPSSSESDNGKCVH